MIHYDHFDDDNSNDDDEEENSEDAGGRSSNSGGTSTTTTTSILAKEHNSINLHVPDEALGDDLYQRINEKEEPGIDIFDDNPSFSSSCDRDDVILDQKWRTLTPWERLIMAASSKPFMTVKRDDVVRSVAFSPDGTKLAVGSLDKTATAVYDIVIGSDVPIVMSVKRDDKVTSVAFSPDGTKLAVGSEDKTAIVYDVSSGIDVKIHMTVERDGRVTSVAFSPDGTKLAVGSDDGILSFFLLLIHHACLMSFPILVKPPSWLIVLIQHCQRDI
jgi:hypothetical protein